MSGWHIFFGFIGLFAAVSGYGALLGNGFFCRKQHKPRRWERKVFTETEDYSYCVADVVHEQCDRCSRCHKRLTEWEEVSRRGIQGLTLSSSSDEELRRTGRTVCHEREAQ